MLKKENSPQPLQTFLLLINHFIQKDYIMICMKIFFELHRGLYMVRLVTLFALIRKYLNERLNTT